MAIIKPFRAIRPAKDKVAFVASRSYEEYDKKERNYHLKYNPFSFLHILNPGYKFQKTIVGEERFSLIRNRYLEFLEEEIFIKDDSECFYLYQIKKGDFSTLGIFCATSVMDYRQDIIKKHEDTIYERELLFANYLKTVGFNAEPVLITYPKNKDIEAIISKESSKTPEYHFTTPDKKSHQLWRIKDPATILSLQQAFSSIDKLYIADGHHRSASSSLLANDLSKGNQQMLGDEPYSYFLSYLIPENEIKIYEFNRMVTDLNGLTKEEFLIQLDTYFRIEKKEDSLYRPTKKHHFGMYLDGEFYSLYLRKQRYTFTDALSQLDTQILYKTILEPILGIHDLRNDSRISYGYGKHNLIKMKESIDKNEFSVGFSLVPITMEEIKAIADAHLVMPPKSTYSEPKLRSGLTIYEI